MRSDMQWNADRTINLHFAESVRPPAIIQQQQIIYIRLIKLVANTTTSPPVFDRCP